MSHLVFSVQKRDLAMMHNSGTSSSKVVSKSKSSIGAMHQLFVSRRRYRTTVTGNAFMLLLLYSTYLFGNVTCMSLDRLGIDRNELLNEEHLQQQQTNDGNESSANIVIDDDMELKEVPAASDGATDAYVLLPAGVLGATIGGGAEQQAAVNQNTFDAEENGETAFAAAEQNANAMEATSDMLMMETNETPVVQQMIPLPSGFNVAQSEQSKTETDFNDTELKKNEELPEMLPVPQALQDATPSSNDDEKEENIKFDVEMLLVPPQNSAEVNKNSVEVLPVPEALVGVPLPAVTPIGTALDEVPAVDEVQQTHDEEEVEQQQLQKDTLIEEEQTDEEKIPENQKIDEESSEIKLPESFESLSAPAPELEPTVEKTENDVVTSLENQSIATPDPEVAKTESESGPSQLQQSTFGAFADAVEAIEEEIIAAADSKLPEMLPIKETKEPELLLPQMVETEGEEEEIAKKPEQNEKLDESAAVEEITKIEDNSAVASAVKDEEQAELYPKDSNQLATSAQAAESQTEEKNESAPPKSSEVVIEESGDENLSESDKENVQQTFVDSSAPAATNQLSANVPEEQLEKLTEEKQQDEEVTATESTPQAAANESNKKIGITEQIKDEEIDVEKIDGAVETENHSKEAAPLEEQNSEMSLTVKEEKDDDSVEEQLFAEIPEQLNTTADKQPETSNPIKSEDNAIVSENKEEVYEQDIPEDELLANDERKEEIVAEKESVAAIEDHKLEENNVESVEQHKEQEAEESEIIEEMHLTEETDENKKEIDQNSIDKSQNMKEIKNEITQKIDIPDENDEYETPQIVENTSQEVKQHLVQEEQKDDTQETLENNEVNEEPLNTDIKGEIVILADTSAQQEVMLEEENHAEKWEILDPINKDNIVTSMPEENHKTEEITAEELENDAKDDIPTVQQTIASSISSTEQKQDEKEAMQTENSISPEAEPVLQQSTPAETDNSMLTTIIQVPQPQQERDASVEMKEPTTINENVAATAEIIDAEIAQQAAQVVVNNEENQAETAEEETVAAVTPLSTQYIESAEMSIVSTQPLQTQQAESNKPQDDTQKDTQQEEQKLQTETNVNNDNEDTTTFNSQLRRYDGAQVWRIVVQNDKDRRMADELQTKYGGQLWKEVKQEVDYLLKPQVLSDAARHIRAANLSRIVLIENLQKVIEVENPPEDEILLLQNRKGHRLTWQAYHRLEDIHGFLDYMAKTYPDICSVETIGYSVEKRPLKILKISNGNVNNPGIWIDGGMHAREWIGPATVTYIVNQLVEGWEDLPTSMKNINWYIHPMANPDGYEYSHTTDRLWRKNMRSHGRQCPGVDLNRNFGYKWGGKGTSANPCSQTYRGSKAFSEPETFYISKFISNAPRNTLQAYLTFHSYGQYILYPWGYDYGVSADRADLDRVARQAGTSITKSSGGKYTVGPAALTLYPAAGGADDWAKGIAGIKYTYTVEMGDTGRFGFVLPASYIEQNGKDGYTFVETVARAITLGRSTERRRRF